MKINKNEWNIWIGMGPANDFYRFFRIFDAFHSFLWIFIDFLVDFLVDFQPKDHRHNQQECCLGHLSWAWKLDSTLTHTSLPRCVKLEGIQEPREAETIANRLSRTGSRGQALADRLSWTGSRGQALADRLSRTGLPGPRLH